MPSKRETTFILSVLQKERMRFYRSGIKSLSSVEMETPTQKSTTPQMVMAVPNEEYVEILRRLVNRSKHCDHITLISKDKEHIQFYLKKDKIKARRFIDGKKIICVVEPLSKLIPNEREWLKKQIHDKNPTYNNARLEYEVDMIYEMRASVKKIVEETGCKPEDAFRALECGLAKREADEKMSLAEGMTEIKEAVEKAEECISND